MKNFLLAFGFLRIRISKFAQRIILRVGQFVLELLNVKNALAAVLSPQPP
jgi:hypothetical protein